MPTDSAMETVDEVVGAIPPPFDRVFRELLSAHPPTAVLERTTTGSWPPTEMLLLYQPQKTARPVSVFGGRAMWSGTLAEFEEIYPVDGLVTTLAEKADAVAVRIFRRA